LRQTRQQCRQLQEELQTANRDFQAFKQQFQEFRQEFQQTQGDFQRERVAFHQEVQATRHELDQAQAACRQENAAILELKQRALAANHDLGQTYKRMRDIDQSLESTWERLSKQMDEQQRLVEHEAETATRLVEARLDEFLEKLRDCERQEVEARERAHHQPGRPTVLIEHNTMVPMEGSTHLGLTVDAEAQILEVAPDTPAQRAGLHPGDVVVKVDSRPINTGEDLREALEHAEAGKELSLTVARKLEAIETKDVVPELALS
jgi:C-terminal processing protease CtpA/Prc